MLFPDCHDTSRAPRLDGLRHATDPIRRGLNLEKSLMNLPNQKNSADLASCSCNVEKNRLGALEWAQQSATFDIIDAWPILKNRFGLRCFDDIGTAIHHPPIILYHSIIIFDATCFTWTKIRDAFHCHILFVRGPADSRQSGISHGWRVPNLSDFRCVIVSGQILIIHKSEI